MKKLVILAALSLVFAASTARAQSFNDPSTGVSLATFANNTITLTNTTTLDGNPEGTQGCDAVNIFGFFVRSTGAPTSISAPTGWTATTLQQGNSGKFVTSYNL